MSYRHRPTGTVCSGWRSHSGHKGRSGNCLASTCSSRTPLPRRSTRTPGRVSVGDPQRRSLRLNAGGWRLGIGRADLRSPAGGHLTRRAGAAHRPELLEAGGKSANRAGVVEVRMGSAAGADSPPGLGLGPVPRRRRIIKDPSSVGAHGVPCDWSRSATDQLRNIDLLPSLNSGGQPLARAFSEKHRAG